MNNKIFIKSADDKDLPVYIYEPSAARIGAVVLIQEIFGVNDHINNVAENFAKEGFVTWVPDLFYRIEDNVNLSYGSEDIKKGKNLKDELGWEPSLQFHEGIERTVKWYLDNNEWVNSVTSGDYQDYYKKMYNKLNS